DLWYRYETLMRHLLAFLSCSVILLVCILFFFFNHTAPTEIYTLSLHDALPILPSCTCGSRFRSRPQTGQRPAQSGRQRILSGRADRKSTRLNSSHLGISYAVFCLKKKKKKKTHVKETLKRENNHNNDTEFRMYT